jgi:hypothetical protein
MLPGGLLGQLGLDAAHPAGLLTPFLSENHKYGQQLSGIFHFQFFFAQLF